MFRKFALGIAAAASLGLAALAPTGASAYDGGSSYRDGNRGGVHRDWRGSHFRDNHRGFGFHRDWRGSQARFRHHGCLQQRLVQTPWGFRYRTVNVCR